MRKPVVGVIGPSDASDAEQEEALELGRLLAQEGCIVLTGGRNTGVMNAACRGAKQARGTTVGILPTAQPEDVSEHVDVAILTGMGSARNNINVLSSDVIVAAGMGAGTASEAALALKAGKQVILLGQDDTSRAFFEKIGKGKVHVASSPEEAAEEAKRILGKYNERHK